MTLLEVEELTKYWTDHPPLHIAVAAYLGIRHPHTQGRRAPGAAPTGPRSASLLAELGPGFSAGDVHAGLPAVALDAAALRAREN